MARIGINPSRGKFSDFHPARVTVVMITHIPHLDGYFKHRLDVLRLSLTSLLTHTSSPYDLLVFDNGSCTAVLDYLFSLKNNGAIKFLLLSNENIGKIGAFRVVFNAALGEVIAYTDDDILFYPNWLEEHLRILDTFPQAGMISGVPVRNASRYATQALTLVENQKMDGLIITPMRRIPDAWEVDWAMSTGRDPQAHLQAMQDHTERVLIKDGVEAIGAANHFQFVSPKQVLLQALPKEWSGRLMGEMVELDEAIDSAGFLRLSTVGRYTRHIGNVISPELEDEVKSLGINYQSGQVRRLIRRRHWLGRIPGVRRILLALYHRIFLILNDIRS